MSMTSLSVLGLPPRAVEKLLELNIRSVEAFCGRVSDSSAIERLGAYLQVDPETMMRAVRRALDFGGPVVSHSRPPPGALIPDDSPKLR